VTALRSPIRAAATVAIAWFAVSTHALAQHPQPAELLAEAKAATGGAAWDALRSQHSRVNIKAGDLRGSGERWASVTTGRSLLRYEIGPLTGLQGFDGLTVWSQDASGETRIESDRDTRELAANAAYRDRLAFWFPERQRAAIEYARRDRADGIDYDVVRLTPEGGRAYEVWIDMLTHRIARLVEREGMATRTEIYSDFRAVQGVTLPFRVRTTRGDPRLDEEYTIEAIEYNVALDGIEFGVPPPPPADVVFVPGKDSIDVPMQVRNGHMFIDVRLNGKGPFHMLFDAGGASVLLPSAVAALGLKPQQAGGADGLSIVAVERLDVGGIDFEQQQFAAIDLGSVMRRVDGVDNVAGIVGFGLVARLPTRIDYERQSLTFYRPRTFKPPTGAARVPFVFDRNMPQIRARVDGLDGGFDVDTGSRASLTLSTPFVRANDLAARYGATREVVSGAGASGHARALLARAGKLSFGGFDVDAPVTYLARAESGPFADPALAGNIGYGVLRRFAITFDYARQLLYFEKNASFGEPDAHDRAGLWLERGERGFDVVDVVADSPAHAAGVVAGDVIVAVNGKPAKSMSLSELRSQLRGAPGTKVRFTLARKGAKEAQIVLRDLV
jgi:hypothetical protein